MQVLIIGNTGLDESWRVARFPASGETILARGVARDLGGKGANQAIVLARCGVPVRFVSSVGDDADGAWLRGLLAEDGLDAAVLPGSSDRSLILTDDAGENMIISTSCQAERIDIVRVRAEIGSASPGDWLLLQGNLTEAATEAALRSARARGVRTALNPAPVRPGFARLWSLVDVAVINQTEAVALAGTADPGLAGARLREAGAACVVVTLGADGALLIGAEGILRQPGIPVAAIDTTGAGDTFVATLVAALALGHAAAIALESACRAAAITVGRSGTRASLPSAAELGALLRPAASARTGD